MTLGLATLSSTGGSTSLRVWEAKTSFLLWEHTSTLSSPSADIAFLPSGDLLLLADCTQLTRLSGKSGEQMWQVQLATE